MLNLLSKITSVYVLSVILIITLVTGLVFSITLSVKAYPASGLEFCFTQDCYVYFKHRFNSSFEVISTTLQLLVSISTIGGIFIAVKSYYSNQYSSSIANHISNTKTFSDFIKVETKKLRLISEQSVSSFLWYNKIFPQSKSGSLQISKVYYEALNRINEVVKKSNLIYSSSEKPDFSYQKHQTHMIEALSGIGIHIERLNRNDFFECESQIIKLIEVTNIEFCGFGENDITLEKRIYI
jgi:hypothetical protein